MSRMYTVTDTDTGVSGTVDVLELKAGASRIIALHDVYVGFLASTPLDEELVLGLISRFTTSGSGGDTLTPRPLDSNDAAAQFVAEGFNDTLAAGTSTLLHNEGVNVRAGWGLRLTPEQRIIVPVNGILAVRVGPISASIDMTMTAYVEEL